ncbi:MAG: hypothetical protein ACOYJZ_02505 [Acutalibacter sp.]|jgi:hypothetical protein
MEYIGRDQEIPFQLPQWKVTFDGQFFLGHKPGKRSGKTLPFTGEFDWAGYHWKVPGVYSCREGLVVDLCMEVDPDQLRAFQDKWNLTRGNDDESRFSLETQMAIQAENPFCFSYSPQLVVNGRTLQRSKGCGVCYAPFEGAVGTDMEAQWVVEHYQLDKTKAWFLWRWCFPWEKSEVGWKGLLLQLGIRKLFTLSLRLQGEPARLPGKPFQVGGPGDTAQLVDPTTGEHYTLTVVGNEATTLNQGIPQGALPENWEFPTCYRELSYTLEPDPPKGVLTLRDYGEGDRPRVGEPLPGKNAPRGVGAATIGIIGGADGPTAVFVSKKSGSQTHVACSSLHFQPVEEVTWLPVFQGPRVPDFQICLRKIM